MFRRSFLITLGVLFACLVAVPAREKQDDACADPAPVAIPAAVSSDHFLFAHLKAKDIRDSALFAEVKQAVTKAGGAADWDKLEDQFSKNLELGMKPTEIDSVTACVTEISEREGPKFVLILTSSKAINKGGIFGLKPDAKPDARGFYTLGGETLAHFPDDKTVAVLRADLAQKYLAGYAKNRTGWPFTAELSKAAAAHTAFVTLRLDKLPAEAKKDRDFREFGPLLAGRVVTFTADLKGKELSIAARATFANATAAGKAKHKAHALVGLVSDELDKILLDKIDFGAVLPALKEAERTLAAVKFEVDGSDLTASASYKADFDFGVMMIEAVKRVRESASQMRAKNNFKQASLAMHSYSSIYDDKMPVHGIGSKGALLKKDEKPLLSWRVAILPFIEQDNLYKQFKFDEPWDSENNKKLIDKMPNIYAPVVKPGKAGYTHMQMVIGPRAMPLFADLKSTFTDGTSNTIAIVEATEAVIWTKPDDVMFPGKELPKDFRKRFGGQFPGGFNVALWDGSVRFVPNTVSDRTIEGALTPAGGEVLGRDW